MGNLKEAIDIYKHYKESSGSHNFEILQQLGLLILQQGASSRDPESILLSMYGAGITMDERALPLLKEGLMSDLPQAQMAALNFLANFQDDRTDELLSRAMASEYLLVRLEAAHFLAQKKSPKAVGQFESLFAKIDPKLHPIFPQLYAMHGSRDAIAQLRRLMNDTSESVRIEAILNAAKYGRDDLLPIIRLLANHLSPGQQEACAIALGMLNDETSSTKLLQLSIAPTPIVRLAAKQALYRLGRHEERQEIERIAQSGNLFAIAMLGEMAGSEDVLFSLMKNEDLQIRANASIALLERQDRRSLLGLLEVMIHDSRDYALLPISSPSHGLSAWKLSSSAKQNFADTPMVLELSTHAREELLVKASALPEDDFLTFAMILFETQQNPLIPTLVVQLEKLHSPKAIALLKKNQQKVGAPLIRAYCNLALYRMQEPGPYANNLKEWIKQQKQVDMIRFRPYLPWEVRKEQASVAYQLTPEETSRLLIESFQSLAQSQDDTAVETLLDALCDGNEKNKYALAGLLLRATN